MSLFTRFKFIPSLVSNVTPQTPVFSRSFALKRQPTAPKITNKNSLELLEEPSESDIDMDYDAMKTELIEQLKKDGVTDQSEIDREVNQFDEMFKNVKKREKEARKYAKVAENNPVAFAYQKNLREELGRANEEFSKMGPITQSTIQLLTEARERISNDMKHKYEFMTGDATERVMQAIGEIDKRKGKFPEKRLKLTPEEFEEKYMLIPEKHFRKEDESKDKLK